MPTPELPLLELPLLELPLLELTLNKLAVAGTVPRCLNGGLKFCLASGMRPVGDWNIGSWLVGLRERGDLVW